MCQVISSVETDDDLCTVENVDEEWLLGRDTRMFHAQKSRTFTEGLGCQNGRNTILDLATREGKERAFG